jgi:NhaA family Na+:H+ antiporter
LRETKNIRQIPVLDILSNPFQRFFQTEASGGIVLICTTVIALFWANSPWSEFYKTILNYNLTFQLGEFFVISKSLLFWVNDGLMAIFFLVVGLEIKREILAGELSEIKQASLPVVAALGGMIVPACLFVFLNYGKPEIKGWGVPMATDIAFSLGILSLLGKKIPLNLKIFLTAFAIVDDIGSVIVIAVFYTHEIYWSFLLAGIGLVTILVIANLSGLRNISFYMLIGFVIWYLFLKSGIHPTIAGVIIAFTIPANRKIRIPFFLKNLNRNINEFNSTEVENDLLLNRKQLSAIDNMEYFIEKVQSPLQRLEHSLHGFVTWFVIPVFALANAGIIFGKNSGMSGIDSLTIYIAVSLVFGKLIGVFGFTYLFIKSGLSTIPGSIKWVHYLGLGLLGGVGFTMSIFISNLAFSDVLMLNHAKIGILFGSLISGISGYLVLRLSLNDKGKGNLLLTDTERSNDENIQKS